MTIPSRSRSRDWYRCFKSLKMSDTSSKDSPRVNLQCNTLPLSPKTQNIELEPYPAAITLLRESNICGALEGVIAEDP